jgi:hypothetical protein
VQCRIRATAGAHLASQSQPDARRPHLLGTIAYLVSEVEQHGAAQGERERQEL